MVTSHKSGVGEKCYSDVFLHLQLLVSSSINTTSMPDESHDKKKANGLTELINGPH